MQKRIVQERGLYKGESVCKGEEGVCKGQGVCKGEVYARENVCKG